MAVHHGQPGRLGRPPGAEPVHQPDGDQPRHLERGQVRQPCPGRGADRLRRSDRRGRSRTAGADHRDRAEHGRAGDPDRVGRGGTRLQPDPVHRYQGASVVLCGLQCGVAGMTRLLLRRVAAIPLIIVVMSLLVFLATEVLPGDVARDILGRQASDASVAALRPSPGLDVSLSTRYLHWAGNFLTGNWGTSYTLNTPVRELVFDRLGNSLLLAAFAFVLLVPVSLALG